MRKKTHEEVEAVFALEGYKLLDRYESLYNKMRYICPKGHQHQSSWRNFSKGVRCFYCAAEGRKRTPEEVEAAFAREGYTLLDKYENVYKKMRYICPKGHQHKIQWITFNQGTRCFYCAAEGRRRTHEEVKSAFALEGYTLLDRYDGAHKKMRYICPKGHKHEINWTNFSQGYRCAHCAGQIVTHERVQSAFKAEGYQLLDKYEHGKKPLNFICPNGHKYKICWDNFNSGNRCAHCAGSIVTHEQVEQAFSKEGYKLLTQYVRNNTKLKFICPSEHQHSITWADFRSGYRCAYCQNLKVDESVVVAAFESEGYQLLNSYQNAKTKLKYICPNGHNHQITWSSFKRGNRCAHCAGKIITHEQVELAFVSEGFQLIDKYIKSTLKMRYICPEGHQHSIIWESFKQGHRCPYCAGMHPTEEQRKINKIKDGIRNTILIYLRRAATKHQFSTTSFARLVAKLVIETIGERPDGHHLDHIIPQSYFDFRNQEEIEACWHIDNLRYLPARENVGRGNRLTVSEVKEFNQTQRWILGKASLRPSKFDSYLSEPLAYIAVPKIAKYEQLTIWNTK